MKLFTLQSSAQQYFVFCFFLSCLTEDPTLSSPLKKRPSSSTGGAGTSKDGQRNDTISSSIAAAVSIKTELYNAPRRSLRQKGLIPEQMGFPYYSPPRPRKTPCEKSNPTDKTDDNPENDPEAVSEGAATDGEQMEHETNKDGVAVKEEDSQPQRRTSGRRSGKGRGRGSNASESSESKKDDSPNQQESSKSDPTASSSSANTSIKVNGSVAGTPKEVRVLNNSHARRQIIRPWEDNTTSSKPIPSIDNLHTNCQKKQLQNGSMSTPPAPTSFSTLTSQRVQQDNRDGPSNGAASNSVQTAAEALVEIGQLPPSREATVESMELETKKTTPLSVSSVTDASSSSPSLALGNCASASLDVPSGPKEVVIDRKRQHGLFHHVTQATESCSVEQMDRLHSTFEHIVFRHRMTLDKQQLIEVNYIQVECLL